MIPFDVFVRPIDMLDKNKQWGEYTLISNSRSVIYVLIETQKEAAPLSFWIILYDPHKRIFFHKICKIWFKTHHCDI